jgi:dTDP-4-dehydrorhamnose reductase
MEQYIFMTGTGGMVGSYVNACAWHAPTMQTDVREFDITNTAQVERFFAQHAKEIGWIIHLAAETDVDRCEQDKDHAMRVNVLGTQNMVYAAQRYDIPLLYVSTVGIFGGDGQLGPFHEFSPPCPANFYGWTKWYGEEIVRQHLTKYFILRAGWMMGGGAKDKKFVMKIIRQLLDGKRELFAIEEIIGSPTYARALVRVMSEMLQTSYWGTYHCTGNGKMSRYDVARVICKEIDPSVRVTPVASNFFNLPAPRATSEYSENRMLTLRGLNTMPSSEDSVRAYVEEIRLTGILDPLRARVAVRP